MLVLTRHIGQSIQIGKDIVITVSEIRGSQARIAIDAPKHVKIMRTELLNEDSRDAGRRL